MEVLSSSGESPFVSSSNLRQSLESSDSDFRPAMHFTEQGKSVFVSWKPWRGECKHRIGVLEGDDFEVICTHMVYDEGNIRAQIRHVLATQAGDKKKQ